MYPRGVKGTEHLAFLAPLFGVVEINVTFYRPITPDQARHWLDAVAEAPDFRFTAKLWQVFTHARRWGPEELAQFREGLEPLLMGGRLGVLLAQFPYSFHNTQENRAYLVKLKGLLQEFPLAVEVRHRSWQQRAVREFLQQVSLNFCNIDQPLVSYPMGATRWVTGSIRYMRLHGRRKDAWFEFGADRQAGYDYLYSPEKLEDLSERVRELQEKASEVYVIFNNHPAGKAVANGLELEHFLTGRTKRIPPCILNAFPRLKELHVADNATSASRSFPMICSGINRFLLISLSPFDLLL